MKITKCYHFTNFIWAKKLILNTQMKDFYQVFKPQPIILISCGMLAIKQLYYNNTPSTHCKSTTSLVHVFVIIHLKMSNIEAVYTWKCEVRLGIAEVFQTSVCLAPPNV